MKGLKRISSSLLIITLSAFMAFTACGGSDDSSEENVTVTGVTVTPSPATILTGNTLQLTAMVSPSNATDKDVIWTSSNEDVATVDADGLVTAVAVGTATITATSDDGPSGTCAITVTATAVHTTEIILPETASVDAGSTVTLTATVTPADSTDAVTWESSNTSVATVSNGIVTGVAEGSATITATSGSYSDTCTVTVNPVAVPPSNFAGTWSGTATIDEDEYGVSWILEQSASAVTIKFGTFQGNEATMAVDGDELEISISWEEENEEEETVNCSITGTLTISGDSMTGSILYTEGEESSPGTMSLTRLSTSTEILEFDVPTITEETDPNDVPIFIQDTTGDSSIEGTDISTVRLAHDSENIYGLVTLNSGTMSQDYIFYILLESEDDYIAIDVYYYSGEEEEGWIVTTDGNEFYYATVSDAQIQFSLPISVLQGITQFTSAKAGILTNDDDYSTVDEADYVGYVKF